MIFMLFLLHTSKLFHIFSRLNILLALKVLKGIRVELVDQCKYREINKKTIKDIYGFFKVCRKEIFRLSGYFESEILLKMIVALNAKIFPKVPFFRLNLILYAASLMILNFLV